MEVLVDRLRIQICWNQIDDSEPTDNAHINVDYGAEDEGVNHCSESVPLGMDLQYFDHHSLG